ncbi:MAG: restriction endonuclease [Bacteroidota bacterium]
MEYANEEINSLVAAYNLLVGGIDNRAHESEDRAYGGIVRAGKGLLVESIAKNMIEIAWKRLGGTSRRLSLNKITVKIPINPEYINSLKSEEVKKYIKENIRNYYYTLKTDVHVYVDEKFVMGIECKAYTENAMLKRILVDFTLFKKKFPKLNCVLLQLESQLGGDFSVLNKPISFGSPSTHTLLSYFDIDLNIITLLEGERKVDKPIHKSGHFKELKTNNIKKAIDVLSNLLKPYL